MTIEEELKALILSRFKSLREFTIYSGMPYSTVNAILTRGVGNSSVSNVIKICQALSISTDELAEGRIVPSEDLNGADVPIIEVSNIVELYKYRAKNSDSMILDGKTLTKDEAQTFIDGLDIIVSLIRKKRKER